MENPFRQLKKNPARSRGFTFIELMVVISVAAIFTSIMIVYSRKSDEHIIFFSESTLLYSSILRAKALAIETFQPTQKQSAEPGEQICGWGIYAEDNTGADQDVFIIFRDLAGPKAANAKICDSASGTFDSDDEIFEIFSLNPALEFYCLDLPPSAGASGCPGGGSQTSIDFLFEPPDPQVIFSAGAEEAIIRLGLKDGSRCMEIRVSEAGQVNQTDLEVCGINKF